MTTTTTTTTTTTDAMADIRIDILSSRNVDIDYATFDGMADAKIIRAFGDTEIWKCTMKDGKTFKVKAKVWEMDF